MKSKIIFLFIAVLSILISIGFFNGVSSIDIASLLTLLFSTAYLAYIAVSYFKDEPPSFSDEISLGLLFLVTAKAAFLAVAGNLLNPYPLDILFIMIFAYLQPLLHAVIYASFISAIDIIPSVLQPDKEALRPVFSLQSVFAVSMMLITAFAVNVVSNNGRKAKKRLEGMIKSMQTSARLVNQHESAEAVVPAISRDETERVSSDSVHKVADSVANTLELLKKTLNCHNCILFEAGHAKREGKKVLTIIASAAPDKDINYEIANESAGNLLGWIAEHKVPLRIANIRDIKGVSYYGRDEAINSFIGVPVVNERDELKAILCADSKEKDAFSAEAERLLMLSAHGISKLLENISILRKMRTETAEFTAFYELSKKLSSTLKFGEILDIALNSSKEIVDYDMAAFILREGSEALKVVSAKGLKASDVMHKIFKTDESIAGLVIKNGKPLSFSDFQEGKRDIQIFPGIFLPIRSVICLPLLVKDGPIGVFIMASKKENLFSSYETKIFEVVATNTAVALSNARAYLQMEKMATIDGLTGLLNHRFFQERLSHEIERAERYKERLSLLLVDIDYFKKVNDTYGHPAGDKILKDISKILVSAIRSVDAAARYGGEEFAIVLVNTAGRGALDTAERIRKIIENNEFDIGAAFIKVTASIGVSAFPDDTGLLDDGGSQRLLISKADSALYTAKREGRNRVYLFKDVSDRVEDNKAV
ncbi:MAG: diguanylate cyclase [Deltaproteobacteria bacterium]|nr:diguanylate cyclase [Deltaproteobacteria bacterium]